MRIVKIISGISANNREGAAPAAPEDLQKFAGHANDMFTLLHDLFQLGYVVTEWKQGSHQVEGTPDGFNMDPFTLTITKGGQTVAQMEVHATGDESLQFDEFIGDQTFYRILALSLLRHAEPEKRPPTESERLLSLLKLGAEQPNTPNGQTVIRVLPLLLEKLTKLP